MTNEYREGFLFVNELSWCSNNVKLNRHRRTEDVVGVRGSTE